MATLSWDVSNEFSIKEMSSHQPEVWTSNSSTTDEADDIYLALAQTLFIVVDPVLTLVGLVGNGLILVVMLGRMQRSTVAVYMSALAVADSLVLILDFINNWLKMGPPNLYLLGLSHHFCRFYRFFFNVCYTYSSWLVVVVTLERFVVVLFPFRAKSICNIKNAIISVSTMPVLIICIYLYNMWAWHINDKGQCDVHPTFVSFQSDIGPWLSAVVYSYIPIAVIILSNTAIVIQLRRARHQRETLSSEDEKGKETQHKITIMVIVVSLTFLVLTVPVTLWYIIIFALGKFIEQGPKLALGETVVLILGLSNHSVNFFLYLITSEKFRLELLQLFRCCPKLSASHGLGGSSFISSGTLNTRMESKSESVAEMSHL